MLTNYIKIPKFFKDYYIYIDVCHEDENYYEISYDEYKGYIEDCENNYVSVSLSDAPSEITLEDAWEAYNN